jgi:hypothetical protein
MKEPIFWLGCSLFLVAISLTAVLTALIPAVQELSRAARSAEKLFDTLNKEFPDTLSAIRMTNLELTELSGEMKDGIKSASSTVQQIDRSLINSKKQVINVTNSGRSFLVGLKAGIKTWQNQNNQD